MSKNETTWNYEYDASGMRIRRTDGTTAYTYVYTGSNLVYMSVGTNALRIGYDLNGSPIGLQYNGVLYFYVTNLQGDIIAILNTNGEPVVNYTYDAWGNILSTTGSMASTLGTLNPLRYRGYVYDQETGLYYLQSRYYNPAWGRFISPDNYPTTGQGLSGNNMFVYCGNNPVSRADSVGEWWHLVIGAAVGVATQYVSDIFTNLAEGKSFAEALKPSSTWVDYGSAAISGALAASGIGLGASVAVNAALGGTTYLANCAIKGEEANALDLTLSVGIGALSGRIGGSGADGARLRGIMSTSKHVLKTAVSPKKIAMYTAKITAVKSTLIKSTARTMAAGFTSNLFNNGRKALTQSIA